MFYGVLNNVVCAAVMYLLWRQNRGRYPGISLWMLDYLLQIVGVALVLFRGYVPDFASYVVGNTLIMGGLLTLYMGLERFVGKVGSQVYNYIFLTVFACVQYYFSFVTPSVSLINEICEQA